MLRILQLSDLHIGQQEEQPNGVDVRKNFLKTLPAINQYKPDFLVVSGDLSFKQGDKEIYRWIRDQLKFPDLPVYAIAGNHDRSWLLGEIFHPEKGLSTEGKLYYFSLKNDELFLFLDTWDGSLGSRQFQWMRETITKYKPERLFIFMHHPPVLADVPHMDSKHAFKEIDAFDQFAKEYGKLMHLFTGHYHFQKNIVMGNLSIHIAPSTFFQMKGEKESFEKDHSVPGLQIIDIDSTKVSVHTHYLFY